MATTYSYPLTDFPSGVDGVFLQQEINVAYPEHFSVRCTGVNLVSSDVEITFEAALDSTELDYLETTIIPNHVPPSNGGYAFLGTDLPDAQAVQIKALSAAGGILIEAGNGGIAIDTTNSVNITAGAACSFTTTAGNLVLDTAGLLNLDGESGVNIGTSSGTAPVNIATDATAHTVTLGNQTGATAVNVNVGTGGFNVNTAAGGAVSLNANGAASNFSSFSTGGSQDLTIGKFGSNTSRFLLTSEGTTSDALFLAAFGGGITASAGSAGTLLFSTGGATVSTQSQLQLVSSQAAGGSVTIDASSGGVNIAAGVFGMALNAAGSGVIFIGNNADTGEITLGASASARTITIGNTTGATRLLERRGTGGVWRSQPAPTDYSDGDQNATLLELETGILTMTPSTTRTITLPAASALVSGLAVNDSLDFRVLNLSGANTITLASGTGGTIVGNTSVAVSSHQDFRLRITSISGGSESYVVYA